MTRQPCPMPGPSIWSMRVTEQFSIVKARQASGFETERQAERGADRAAMRDGDDVAAAMRFEQPVDRARHPLPSHRRSSRRPARAHAPGACQKRWNAPPRDWRSSS